MKIKEIPGIPRQRKGGFHNTESIKKFDNPEMAVQEFIILKNRLYSVNEWKDFCGNGFAGFKLYDSSGNYADRIPVKGDFIRIDIPGPGTLEAGFDWVTIIDISDQYTKEDEFENILITCRPSKEPGNSRKKYTAHFYSSSATSTFMISRGNTYIKAAVYGRNETANLDANFLDTIRNLVIALGGMIGISRIQWKRLTDALLDF
ncbi:hypothetical protein MP478_01650 [Chryseobacterium sp. WG14]|uniref:hypothetical protein n=1 Tax=unclassified Chryseobacterium TaxID=2593645 RepID=UPI00211EC23E|nr:MULTISPECIES: hypothetical protein [unclassified Chryseobacterium]MCQ9634256.1 hypothetical protein [Chryseobacterium sp. WG23]MCQ9638077.1 hypothetical protein [Chryseobacterium sp. WG14]